MATLPQDLLTNAYSRSMKNQPQFIANEAVELLAEVNRVVHTFFSIAAQRNPTYFGVVAVVSEVANEWTLPPESESVYWIEDALGAEVITVAAWDKLADESKLSLLPIADTLIKTGVNDPAGDLTFYYAKSPTNATSLTTPIDPLWRDEWNLLLILELALFLAIKDGRAEEYAGIVAQRDAEANRFVSMLERHMANQRSRFGPTLAIHTQTTVAPSDLLIQP